MKGNDMDKKQVRQFPLRTPEGSSPRRLFSTSSIFVADRLQLQVCEEFMKVADMGLADIICTIE